MKALKRNSDNLILCVGTEIAEHTTVAVDTGNTIPCYQVDGDPEDTCIEEVNGEKIRRYHLSNENLSFTIVDLDLESNVPADIQKHSKYILDAGVFTENPDYKGV